MAEVSYSLEDLIDAAAAAERLTLNERTAHQYLAQGLLPPPRGQSGSVVYTEEHLARLRLILRLVGQYVPLPEIGRWLAGLSSAQVRALLDRPSLPRLPAEGDAHAYLARLRRSVATAAAQIATQESQPAAAPTRPRRAAVPAVQPIKPRNQTTWLRIAIDSDVELHVRAAGAGPSADLLDRMIDAIQAVLAGERGADRMEGPLP